MVIDGIRETLFRLQDKKYRDFQYKLITTVDPENIIGVRTPALREYARQLARQADTAVFLNDLPHRYFDENQLHAFIISEIRDFDMCIAAFQMDVVPDPGFMLMSGNTGNYCGYKSSAMDSLFKKLRTERDFSGYQQTLWQIQDLFAEDCPFICMWYRAGALLTRKVFTTVRDVREPEILRGIEMAGK